MLGHRAIDEVGEFGIRGKAKRNDASQWQRTSDGELCGREERLVAQLLFETDEAILNGDGIGSCFHAGNDECNREDHDPQAKRKCRIVADEGPHHGDDYVESEDQDRGMVHEIHSRVVLQGLRSRHEGDLSGIRRIIPSVAVA